MASAFRQVRPSSSGILHISLSETIIEILIIGNIASYWQPMLDLIDHMINLGFADANMRDYFQVANNTDEIQNLLRSALKTAHV